MSVSENISPNTRMKPVTYEVNEAGESVLGGVSLVDLAHRYGTPLYVLDEATIRASAQAYQTALKNYYPADSLPLYACKANMNMGLVKLMAQEGFGLDVVSGGEIYTAIQAGFPAEHMLFNGNNKSIEELTLAIESGIGRISADNFRDLALIHRIAKSLDKRVGILLRITPGIECHTHDYIKTGHSDSKFGFDMSHLGRAVDLITSEYASTIDLKGLHAHIGSQIFEVKPYEDLVELMLNIYYNIREQFSLTLSDLDIGGGLGVVYSGEDDPPAIGTALERITQKITAYAEQLNFPLPRLLLEPGRSMIATAGVTLYTIGSTKDIPKIRKYVAVDGGMGDNIRPALYQAQYSAVVANKIHHPAEETVTIVGKYCESGDVLIQNLPIPQVEAGDILAVFGTGAYNYSMASSYNRIPRPAVALVENGRSHLLVQRETYHTIIQQDLIPDHLMKAPSVAATSTAN